MTAIVPWSGIPKDLSGPAVTRHELANREIDWWLANRDAAPILIDPHGGGDRYVPDAIDARWPRIQRIGLPEADWEGQLLSHYRLIVFGPSARTLEDWRQPVVQTDSEPTSRHNHEPIADGIGGYRRPVRSLRHHARRIGFRGDVPNRRDRLRTLRFQPLRQIARGVGRDSRDSRTRTGVRLDDPTTDAVRSAGNEHDLAVEPTLRSLLPD